MANNRDSESVTTKCLRIAELARRLPTSRLTALAHHMDIDWMREAYARTRKDGAVGIDRQTGRQYAEGLDENLTDLLGRVKTGAYRASPMRRSYIPKGNGERRPLGIPTFEDKVLQRAVAMVLESVYEQDFLPCSYGFRPFFGLCERRQEDLVKLRDNGHSTDSRNLYSGFRVSEPLAR